MKQIIVILMLTGLLAMTTVVVRASRRLKEKCQNRRSEVISQPGSVNQAKEDVYLQPLFVFE